MRTLALTALSLSVRIEAGDQDASQAHQASDSEVDARPADTATATRAESALGNPTRKAWPTTPLRRNGKDQGRRSNEPAADTGTTK